MTNRNIERAAESQAAELLYLKAQELSAAGDKAAAMAQLEQAAQAGHAQACYTLASYLTHGAAGQIDRVQALSYLQQGADLRDPKSAPLIGLCAALFEARGIGLEKPKWQDAIARLGTIATTGHPAALRQLAMLVCITADNDTGEKPAAAHAYELATELFYAAVRRKDGLAAIALMRMAAENRPGVDSHLNKAQARFLVQALKGSGHPAIASIERALGEGETEPLPDRKSDIGRHVEKATEHLKVPPHPSIPNPATSYKSPYIRRFDGIFSSLECDYLMGHAGRMLVPSQIVDPTTGKRRPDPYRTSLMASLYPFDQDLVTHAIDLKTAALTNVDWRQGEMLSVLCYGPGQEYKPHFDAFDDDAGEGSKQIAASGQRIATVLIGLNDEYDGGATHFPKADLSFRLGIGDALLFSNVTADGQRDPQSLHAGLPIKAGRKWLASKWYRERYFQW